MAKSHPSQGVASTIDDCYCKELTFDSLWELYVNQRYSRSEIASIFDTTADKVRNMIVSVGVFRPKQLQTSRERLKELYHNQGMSMEEISDELDIGIASVSRHVTYFGLSKTPSRIKRDRNPGGPNLRTSKRGYVQWSLPGKDGGNYGVHRLVAVAEYGIDAVANNDVHHKNGIKWDNRPSNLQPMSKAEHTKETKKEIMKSQLRRLSDEEVKRVLSCAGYKKAAKIIE